MITAFWNRIVIATSLTVALLSAADIAAQDIEVGDSIQRVILVLGEPKGRLARGNTEIFYYERGTVTLVNNGVRSSRIVSQEEARRQKEQRLRETQRRKEAAEEARAERIEKGSAEKKNTNADSKFKQLPTENQLTYWRRFQKMYPEVPVDMEITELEEKLRAARLEAGKKKTEALGEEIRNLEKQIEETEAEASNLGTWESYRLAAAYKLIDLRKQLKELKGKEKSLEKNSSR